MSRSDVDLPVTRREFARRSGLVAASVAGLSGVISACGGSDESKGTTGSGSGSKSLVFATYGGAYGEALQATFVDGFKKQAGIEVRLTQNTSLASLKKQIQAGALQWDIAELTGPEYELAVEQGVPLEKLDLNVINTANIPEYALKPTGYQYAYFLNVMTWDKRQVKKPPTTWAEFFDPKAYSVKRSLYDTISDSLVLEFAQLAQGVPMDKLYPLDFAHALKGIEQLPPDKVLWYSTSDQVIQQLQSRESGLGMPPTGRVIAAAKKGAPLDFTPSQGGVTSDFLVVPKGAKNGAAAMKFLNFIANDVPSAAEFMKMTQYGVANLKAVEALPADVASNIPTNPALEGKIFFRDSAWWVQNLETVAAEFQAWQTKYGK